ncbi:MAG: TonB family protein [Bacteroidales bacterium]|nr:TonB family protein [Bacteroidales bacterium]
MKLNINKIYILLITLFVSVPLSAQFRNDISYDDLYDSETTGALKTHIRSLSASHLEGRKAGTEGEKLAADYVRQAFKDSGVDVISPEEGDVFGIKTEAGDTLTSRNVVGFVQGYDKELRNRYIVVGARLDNLGTITVNVDGRKVERVYYGANGNASGLAAMLELARMVQTNSILFRRSVLFVAFGASAETYAGAWYFLNRSFGDADSIDAMINLDMLGTGSNGFYAYTSSNADMNTIITALTGELQPVQPQITAAEPYPSDHRAFYSKEIPSVMFTTGKYPEHNTDRDTESIIEYDALERELEYLYNFTLAVANTNIKLAFRSDKVPSRGPSYDDVVSYYDCDYRPAFLNSTDPAQFLEKWVYQYLKYPESAVRNGIQGKVMVDFIIGKDGKVTDVRVVRGVDPELDEEAVRVVSASPKWKPGRVNGVKVRTSMTIPVEFRLTKKGKGNFGFKKHSY